LTTLAATPAIRISFCFRISCPFFLFFTAKTIELNLVYGLYLFSLDKIHLGSPCILIGLKVSISSFRSLELFSPKKGGMGMLWATIWAQGSSFCSLLKEKQLDQISLYLTRKSVLYSSVVVRRIFYFSLVLAIETMTGFFVCSLDANNWLILFCVEKISKGWSFWSVTRTSLLSCSCFFFL